MIGWDNTMDACETPETVFLSLVIYTFHIAISVADIGRRNVKTKTTLDCHSRAPRLYDYVKLSRSMEYVPFYVTFVNSPMGENVLREDTD